MRVAFCILVVVALSALAAANANESRVAWQRGDDPFMRMAKKVGSPVLLEVAGAPKDGESHEEHEEVHDEVHEEVLHDENGPTPAAKKDNPAQAKIDANKAKVQNTAADGNKKADGEKPAAKPEAAKSQQKPDAQNKKEDKPTLPPSPAQSQSNGKVAPKETAAPKAVMKMLDGAGKGEASKDNIKDQANKKVAGALQAVAAGGQATAGNAPAPAAAGKPGAACQGVPICQTKTAEEGSQKKNYTMLVPVKKDGNKVDVKKMGGTDKMSVENKDFKKAEKVLEKVDDSHEAFVNKHEKDCKGKICPLEGDKDKKKF